jgi:hypothetical protein
VDENRAHLIALSVAAELQFPCSRVSTNEPVALGVDGSFASTGEFLGSRSMVYQPHPRGRVTGRLLGDRVTLTLDVLDDGAPGWSLTLERGVDPHFENQPPICPQVD